MEETGLRHWGDITVVSLYFAVLLAVGLWASCRGRRGSVKSYFLAGRNMSWIPVGASLLSSNIGSEHFVGLAGSGAASGIANIMYEWGSFPPIILLGWLFIPVYISAGVYTMPEFMTRRFGGKRIRIYLSVLALCLYIIAKLAVSVYAGALFIQVAMAWDMYLSIAGLLLLTAVFTVVGGLAAVMYTDTFQTAVMMIGAVVLAVFSFSRVGGYEAMQYRYMEAIANATGSNVTCGLPRADAFHVLRDPLTSDNPWPGLLVQGTMGGVWYWCADQVIVQRSLSARNLSHAKAGSLVAGYLKLLPLFLMVFPGMISRTLFPDTVGCVDAEQCEKFCGNAVGCSNMAYPVLVLELMPAGLRGLLMAVMLSGIMSSLTSIFNSSATVFSLDLWRNFRRTASQRELLIVGRVFVVFMCLVSIGWVPLVKSSQGGQLFNYINAIQSYLGAPVGVLFLLSVLWTRMNEKGAFWGILVGHVSGVIRLALDLAYPAPSCGQPDPRPLVLSSVHFTHYCVIGMSVTAIAIVVISLLTQPLPSEEVEGVTWWTRVGAVRTEDSTCFPMDEEVINLRLDDPHTPDKAEMNGSSDVTQRRSKWRRLVALVCGGSKPGGDEAPDITMAQRRVFLQEQPTWRRFLDANAVVAMVITAFLIGFYA